MDTDEITTQGREAPLYPNCYESVVPNGRICPVSGLRHAQLYQQLLHGEASKHVRVVSLRQPGTKRGKLLFHRGDMLRWLDGLAAEQAARRRPGTPDQGARRTST